MVFKKKESTAEKMARLRKELEAVEAEIKVPEPPKIPEETRVHEMTSEETRPGVAESFVAELEARFGLVFPELGPSGHAHVERWLLLALIAEVRALREEMRR